jgi:hypothetical protein
MKPIRCWEKYVTFTFTLNRAERDGIHGIRTHMLCYRNRYWLHIDCEELFRFSLRLYENYAFEIPFFLPVSSSWD